MYRISELAQQVGLSRSTLLYYEKLGLICGNRLDNGYRTYSEQDVQRVKLLQQLQAGGLTLKECQACLDSQINRESLVQRLAILDEDIAKKQKARELLAAMLGRHSMREWHQNMDSQAPAAHFDWLIKQGFSEKEALRLRWISKDMNTHDSYMNDFFRVFDPLERWGPGSEADTLRALAKVPFVPEQLLEVGCGQGIATTVLAAHCPAPITAVDNHDAALDRLARRAGECGVADKITAVTASMTDLPFADEAFDVIWAESSAYVMGVENAFKQWKRLLTPGGVLVLSDLVWSCDTPDDEVRAFWLNEYPDIDDEKVRTVQAKQAGYEVLDSFALSDESWAAYYEPLQAQVDALEADMAESSAMRDIKKELAIYRQRGRQFDYQMFVLQKR